MHTNKSFRIVIALLASSTLTVAQNANQAAVDTLTKDVAIAVFANINQPKAQEIRAQLLTCSDGCDPQQVIRGVGSWDQVGAKMQELSELKNTQPFQSMSPGEANAAIRKQLTRFYTAHKAEKPYSVPLSPAVQAQILAKIDGLLPPDEVAAPVSTVASSPTIAQPESDKETDIPAQTPSEGQRGTSDDKLFWMILAGFIAGLLGGAAAIYFLLYKEQKAQADQLRFENSKLSRSLDAAQRPKPANVPRQPQDADQQKARAYEVLLGELGTDVDPLEAIRQLKQQPSAKISETTPVTRSGQPAVESDATLESALVQNQPPVIPVQLVPEPIQAPARSEVFYFPPPDPSGQFDMAQKSGALSPESAYRFSISADDPSVATFRFEADPGRVARFLTYRNYMIEPACESENSYTNTYTRIAMRKDGQAALENGAWRVKTKALIRYE